MHLIFSFHSLGNPVLCDEKITETITAMESKNNTKIHGSAQCPPETQPIVIQERKTDFNSTSTLLEPEVIAAQPQPLISPLPQTT